MESWNHLGMEFFVNVYTECAPEGWAWVPGGFMSLPFVPLVVWVQAHPEEAMDKDLFYWVWYSDLVNPLMTFFLRIKSTLLRIN